MRVTVAWKILRSVVLHEFAKAPDADAIYLFVVQVDI